MKAAVAAGVDGIDVDYPRLGADAVGRPVEHKLQKLILEANSGESDTRAAAILELCRCTGLPPQDDFFALVARCRRSRFACPRAGSRNQASKTTGVRVCPSLAVRQYRRAGERRLGLGMLAPCRFIATPVAGQRSSSASVDSTDAGTRDG
jgi:hypothetical protein